VAGVARGPAQQEGMGKEETIFPLLAKEEEFIVLKISYFP